MSLVYVAGLSGSGKSTLAEHFKELGYEAHDADKELCQWIDNETGEPVEYPRNKANRAPDWQERHSFIISETLIGKLKEQAKDKNIFIFGIAPNDLKLAPLYFDKVYFLSISKDEMVRRVTTRTDNKYGHDEDQLTIIKKWYQPTIEKYKAYGATFINAAQPLRTVASDILGQSRLRID